MDRFQILLFSFYREEDYFFQARLAPLKNCRISRSWGCIRIECLDDHHLEEVSHLLNYLILPFSLLSLGKKIVLRAPGTVPETYSMETATHMDLLAD